MIIQACSSVLCVQMVLRYLKFESNSIFPSLKAQMVSSLNFWSLRILPLQKHSLEFLTSPKSLELFLNIWKKKNNNVFPIYKKGRRVILETLDLFPWALLFVIFGETCCQKIGTANTLAKNAGLAAEGQHGFCQGGSCATHLVTMVIMYHDWYSIHD